MLAEIYCSLTLLLTPTDTLHVSLENAEKMFAEKNLLILAQSYQVEATKRSKYKPGYTRMPNCRAR